MDYTEALGMDYAEEAITRLFGTCPQSQTDDESYFWLEYENGSVWVHFEFVDGAEHVVGQGKAVCTGIDFSLSTPDASGFKGKLPFGIPNPVTIDLLVETLGSPKQRTETMPLITVNVLTDLLP